MNDCKNCNHKCLTFTMACSFAEKEITYMFLKLIKSKYAEELFIPWAV